MTRIRWWYVFGGLRMSVAWTLLNELFPKFCDQNFFGCKNNECTLKASLHHVTHWHRPLAVWPSAWRVLSSVHFGWVCWWWRSWCTVIRPICSHPAAFLADSIAILCYDWAYDDDDDYCLNWRNNRCATANDHLAVVMVPAMTQHLCPHQYLEMTFCSRIFFLVSKSLSTNN